jgi:hypothetical protein
MNCINIIKRREDEHHDRLLTMMINTQFSLGAQREEMMSITIPID